MSLLEALNDALTNLGKHKLRTSLTMLGMIFGVGAVIAMLSIGAGGERQALESISRLGLHNVIVKARVIESERRAEVRKKSLGVSLRDGEAILEAVPGVEAVLPRIEISPYKIMSATARTEADVFGLSWRQIDFASVDVLEGRFFDETDDREHAQVCLIGSEVQRDLFGDGQTIGEMLKIDDVWLEVIGVLGSESSNPLSPDDGSFLYLKLPSGDTGDVLWLPVIAVLSAPIGALVALPFARLRGLYLALGSMAFAHGMANLFFPHPDVLPSAGTVVIPYFDVFGWTLDDRRTFLIAQVVVLAVAILGLTVLRRSRYARRWIALNNSPAASAMVGVDVIETKLVVYSISAAMAGVGGAFYTVALQSADGIRSFELIGGLAIVLLMAVGGMARPAAALFTMFIPVNRALEQRYAALGNVPDLVTIQKRIRELGIGLASIGMAFRHQGAAADVGGRLAPLLPWRTDAREEKRLDKLAGREPEVGELGLHRDFSPDAVLALDRTLGIVDEVTPSDGYPGSAGLLLPPTDHSEEARVRADAASH